MPKENAHSDGRTRRLLRLGGAVLALVAVAGAGLLGWRWYRSLPVRHVVVEGAVHAAPDSLAKLAGVRLGEPLYRLRPRVVADRVQRHPWVKSAEASRRADGTLRLRVAERTPAALVVQGSAGVRYLSAEGFPLPLAEGAAFDVPLVRGLEEAYHPLRPTGHAALRRLLAALRQRPGAGTLVSEIRLRPDSALTLRTAPDGQGRSAQVRLGRRGFPKKLRTLRAFWQQAVRAQPGTAFREIDLRFGGQVVTRQTPAPSSPQTPD